jgi:myosin heavy subunit
VVKKFRGGIMDSFLDFFSCCCRRQIEPLRVREEPRPSGVEADQDEQDSRGSTRNGFFRQTDYYQSGSRSNVLSPQSPQSPTSITDPLLGRNRSLTGVFSSTIPQTPVQPRTVSYSRFSGSGEMDEEQPGQQIGQEEPLSARFTPIFRTQSNFLKEVQDFDKIQLQKNYNTINELYNQTTGELETIKKENQTLINSYEDRIFNLNNEISALKFKLEALLIQEKFLTNQHTQDLFNKTTFETEQVKKERIIQEKEFRIEILEHELEKSNKKSIEFDEMIKEIENLKNDIAILTSENSKLKDKISLIHIDVSKKDESIAQLEEAIKKNEEEIIGYKLVVKKQTKSRKNVQQTIEKLLQASEKQDERERELSEQEADADTEIFYVNKLGDELLTLRQEVIPQRELIDKQEVQIRAFKDNNTFLKKSIKKLKKDNEILETEIQSYNEKNRQLVSKTEILKKENELLRKEVQISGEKINEILTTTQQLFTSGELIEKAS